MQSLKPYETSNFVYFISLYPVYYYRVGWSIDQPDLGLGEVDNSYGYGGTGKTSSGNKFFSYGEPYGPGDVIGCFLVSAVAEKCDKNHSYYYVHPRSLPNTRSIWIPSEINMHPRSPQNTRSIGIPLVKYASPDP
jgi:hypothetical protein